MARFVFVHGAWHGGWCWERVMTELERRGHETLAVDLPSEEPGLTVGDYAEAVGPHEDAVVVGHSLAGLTIPFVPAGLTVFLAALLPVEGVYGRMLLPEFTGTARDELGRSYWPDYAAARTHLYPELDEADARWAFERLRRQAPLEPVAALPPGRRASIVTMADRVVSPAAQECGAREVLGVDPLFLDSGHSPFLSRPGALSDLLASLA